MPLIPESQRNAPYAFRHNPVINTENPECCSVCSFPIQNLSRHYPIGNSVPAEKARVAELASALREKEADLLKGELGMAGRVNVDDLAGQHDLCQQKVRFSSGAVSTKQVRLALIPRLGLINAAERFELGLARHPEGAYNALTNQSPLKDRQWLIERVSHCIAHSYKLLEYLSEPDRQIYSPNLTLDPAADAGAIAWCGLVLGEALLSSGVNPKEKP